jgi:hypothetical protein
VVHKISHPILCVPVYQKKRASYQNIF